MHADYIANPLYDNNPFIEALPPMLWQSSHPITIVTVTAAPGNACNCCPLYTSFTSRYP